MNAHSPRHIVAFGLITGSAIYVLSVLWSVFFIAAVPMDPDWCVDAVEFEVGPSEYETIRVDFKNSLEEAKYYHNMRMQQRNRKWVWTTLAFGAAAGVSIFWWLPRFRGNTPDNDAFGIGLALGATSALLVPLLLSSLLPPPVEWWPDPIRQVAESRVQDALSEVSASLVD